MKLEYNKITDKKIRLANKILEVYSMNGSLRTTAAVTGKSVNTVRKLIKLASSEAQEKKSTKRKEYIYNNINNINNINNNNINYVESGIENKKIKENIQPAAIGETLKIQKNGKPTIGGELKNRNENGIENRNENRNAEMGIDTDALINKDINSIKDGILIKQLDSISLQYLNYLKNPSDEALKKTSLKDFSIIAGVLLDKKILIQHKQADVIKNQSIIFNLFGNNENLASFISDVLNRQSKLASKPINNIPIMAGKQ